MSKKKLIHISESELTSLIKSVLSEERPFGGQLDQGPIKPKPESPKKRRLPSITLETVLCDIVCGRAAVRVADRGDLVKLFQEALNRCNKPPLVQLDTDGRFGNLTRNAVLTFQKNEGIITDGAIGPETSNKLCEKNCLKGCGECKCNSQGGQVMMPVDTVGSVGSVPGVSKKTDCKKIMDCYKKLSDESSYTNYKDFANDLINCVGCKSTSDTEVKPNMPNWGGMPKCEGCRAYINRQPGPNRPMELTKDEKRCIDNGCSKIAQ